MTEQSINMLPPARRERLAREYFVRLGVLFLSLVTVMTVVASVLLIPTYIYLTQNLEARQQYAASLGDGGATSLTEISERRKALASRVATLTPLMTEPSVSELVRNVLAAPRTGVAILSLSYSRGVATNPGVLLVSGTAATRDALQAYQRTLQAAPYVSTAEVPVSAFAKDADLPFTITVTPAP